MSTKGPEDLGPAATVGVSLLILTSLADGEKHGHSLMKDIEEFAGVRLGPGTLYKAISRLESAGLIESLDPDERRRPYRMTPAGCNELSRSFENLDRIAEEFRRRMRPPKRPLTLTPSPIG